MRDDFLGRGGSWWLVGNDKAREVEQAYATMSDCSLGDMKLDLTACRTLLALWMDAR